MTLVASASVGLGGRVAYLETASRLGALLEVIEFTPAVEGVFGMIRAASESWDGTDPVRQMGPPR